MPTLKGMIAPESPLHATIKSELEKRILLSESKLDGPRARWSKAEDTMLAYMPERDADKVRRATRESGLPQYTTIQIPYSYAVAMTAHTYFTSVFLSRNPIFQYMGLHGETQQQEQAIEALVAYQSSQGGIVPHMYSWFYDACKYGCAILGTFWAKEMNAVTTLEEVVEIEGAEPKLTGITQMLPGYTGNKAYPIAPKNFLWDPRVSFRNFQEGEYCAVRVRLGWNQIVKRHADGFYTNIEKIDPNIKEDFRQTFDDSMLETPTSLNASGNPQTGFTFGRADSETKKNPTIVPCYEVYIELIPKEWGLSESNYPEKWVFTYTADFKVVIGATPLGLFHNKFPFDILELEPDALALTNRGIPDILSGVQQTVDWLVNSHFYNIRAALNNQFLVDPSRVVMKDVLDPLPGGVIRAKPSAYGQDMRTMLYQLPVQDVTQAHMKDLPQILSVGERVLGVNEQMMGMIAAGGRKTATEVRTSSSFGIGRLKTNTEYMGAMGVSPLASKLVQNNQQLYDMEMKLKIVGNLSMDSPEKFLIVSPEAISGNYEFMPVDGTLPIDRMAQVMLWKDLFAQIRQFPQIYMTYDMGRIFSWVAKLAGIRNIDQFKLDPRAAMMNAMQMQVVPDEQMQREAQSGNSIPMAPSENGSPSLNPIM